MLNIPKQSFRGTCSIRINPVRSGIDKLTLDAVNLNIESVKVGETEQNFDSDGEVLQVQLHEPTEAYQPITIAMEILRVEKPQRGLYFRPGQTLSRQTNTSLDSRRRRRFPLLVSLFRLSWTTCYFRNSSASSETTICYFQRRIN